MTIGVALALAGAAIALAVAAFGSSLAVGRMGAASSALLSKEPKYFSRLLILMLLPSSQVIYGLTVAFMIFVQLGVLPGATLVPIDTQSGLGILFLCLPVGIIGGTSAIAQGNAGVAAINLFGKQNKMFGNCILIISASEVFALFGFLISMLGVMFLDLSLVDSCVACAELEALCEACKEAAEAVSPILHSVGHRLGAVLKA
ncbi:MAG: permease [Firmicutes bacterium]|nr:permease [Bacillota bacterium]